MPGFTTADRLNHLNFLQRRISELAALANKEKDKGNWAGATPLFEEVGVLSREH